MKKNYVMSFLLLCFLSLNANAFAPNPKDTALKADLYAQVTKNHHAVGYDKAKKLLFGQLYLEKDDNGYFITDLYCGIHYTKGVGPGNLPDQNQLNTEHTWPQSKFVGGFPTETQKSDLHHLFPTDSKANSTRGNFAFADVTENINLKDCDASKSGPSVTSGGKTFFEPPLSHKGNVARALFYFSIRYKAPIDAAQEEFLRRWNDLDPVDDAERTRNNDIEKLQGNKNPFIDHPELVDQISDF
ncbi:MAG: endonuclease [Bacteriovorax sp.]|nr:endonuclease [Bacteriovorax sp.]